MIGISIVPAMRNQGVRLKLRDLAFGSLANIDHHFGIKPATRQIAIDDVRNTQNSKALFGI